MYIIKNEYNFNTRSKQISLASNNQLQFVTNYWRMIQIEKQQNNHQIVIELITDKRDKMVQFQNEIRSRQIEQHKKKIRQQKQAIYTLNLLLQSVPENLDQVLVWCSSLLNQFSKSSVFQIPNWKVIELFKLVEKYPCQQTIEILRLIAYKISVVGIHELFQYDVVGLLHRIISFPEKVTIKTISNQKNLSFVQVNLVRNCLLTLAALCQQSQKARNFIVINHKSFLCITKAYQRFGVQIRPEWLFTLCTLTKHNLFHDEQFVRIIKKLILTFCDQSNTNLGELIIIIKSLTNVIKSKQKWAMDMIQSTIQYDVIQRALQLLKLSRVPKDLSPFNISNVGEYEKQLSILLHNLNLFIIHYVEISTNQYFSWNEFFTEWFYILNTMHENPYMGPVKKDIYFIINNNLSENDETASTPHICQRLIFSHNCIQVFATNLEKQNNPDVLSELSQAIGSLFSFHKIQNIAQDLINSELLTIILQAITNRGLHLNGTSVVYFLISALNQLLQRTNDKKMKKQFGYIIMGYERKLSLLASSSIIQQGYGQLIDNLLTSIQNIY